MKRAAFENLRCPGTLAPLRLEAHEMDGEEVLAGSLAGGADTYPIREGIPSFLSEEAARDQTLQSFSQKWASHQYYRAHTGAFYTNWFLQRYGFDTLEDLTSLLEARPFVLDAGTGMGRDALNFARHSSAEVFAVDAAREALTVARADVDHPRVSFVHADIDALPFGDGFFDFINCDQVIHHMPNPRATFERLCRKLKPGGQICVYVYRKKAVLREFSDDYVRERLSRLPVDEALEVCAGITELGRALAELNTTVEIKKDIPVLGIRKGSIDVQRFIHWNVMKCFWNQDFDFFTNNIINYDWYHPTNCFRFDPEAFREWFASGFRIESWDVSEPGISCRATKVRP